MDYFQRLIALFLFLVSGSACALVPVASSYEINFGPSKYPMSSLSTDGCKAAVAAHYGSSYPYIDGTTYSSSGGTYGQCSGLWGVATPYLKSQQCPVNSIAVTGGCLCYAGHHEEDGACVPDNQCVPGIIGGSSGKAAGSYCQAGCVVAATTHVTPSGSKQVWMTTGEKCVEENKPPPDAPGGPDAPEPDGPCEGGASVCMPKDGTCPKGSFPSEVGDQVVCIGFKQPDEAKPTGKTEGATSSDEVTTEKKTENPDGSVTTEKTTNGNSSKPNEISSFCKENPQASMCGEQGGFTGSCGQFTCSGDAVQCAQAREVAELRCRFSVDANHSTVQTAQQAMGSSASGVQTSSAGVGQFNSTNPYSVTCVSDVTVAVAGMSFVIPLSESCPYLAFVGWCLVAGATLAGARIAFT